MDEQSRRAVVVVGYFIGTIVGAILMDLAGQEGMGMWSRIGLFSLIQGLLFYILFMTLIGGWHG